MCAYVFVCKGVYAYVSNSAIINRMSVLYKDNGIICKVNIETVADQRAVINAKKTVYDMCTGILPVASYNLDDFWAKDF